MPKGIYINDSIHGLIRLSEYEKQIVSSVGFNRLHDVYQNSTVYLTYPSNRTKRFEHSIGTMKLCSDMFFHSIENATDADIQEFYKCYDEELKKVISGIKKQIDKYDFLPQTPKELPEIQIDSFRIALIPHNVPKDREVLHLVLAESIRVAALLHDIGHPPFSHVVERAMKSAYMLSKGNRQSAWKQYRSKMERYFGGEKRALHEVMGDEISSSILKDIARSNCKEGNESECLFQILVLECVLKIFGETTLPFQALHRLVDGSLDGDRLDYVTRDPVNSGLKNGSIDYSRIILDMQMIMSRSIPIFCVPVKAVNAVEDFLKRRYDLYKTIIFHHRVIKTDYLLEHSVKNLIETYMEKHKGKVSEEDDFIPFDISGLWYPLGAATMEEKGNELSQWNDSWLMTILKKIYFTEYYHRKGVLGLKEDITERQLAELLRHKKNYYSLVKRNEDFRHIDSAVQKEFDREKNKLNERVKELKETSAKAQELLTRTEKHPRTAVIDINGTLDVIKELLGEVVHDGDRYILPYIMGRRKLIGVEDFEDKVREIVDKACRDQFNRTYDTITVFKTISVGTDEYAIYFYDSRQEIYTLDNISGIARSLRRENDFRPLFYIYALIKEEADIIDTRKKELLEIIGKKNWRNCD